MKNHLIALATAASATMTMLAFTAVHSSGQAPAAAPAYQVPRTPFGQPDLQGVWQAVNTANWNIQDHSAELGMPAGQGIVEGNEIPYLPLALAKRDENRRKRLTDDTEAKCFMVGTPRINYMPYPFEIVQTPTQVTVLYEYVHTTRHLRLNGRHPEGAIQWFMGDSRARWEGDELVVETTNLTDQTSIGPNGNGLRHSDKMKITERFKRVGDQILQYQITVDDPVTYARPFTLSLPLTPLDGGTLLPYECHEGNYAIRQSLGAERAEDQKVEADLKRGIIRPRRPVQDGLGVGGQPIGEAGPGGLVPGRGAGPGN